MKGRVLGFRACVGEADEDLQTLTTLTCQWDGRVDAAQHNLQQKLAERNPR